MYQKLLAEIPKEAAETAQVLSRFVNGMSNDIGHVVAALATDHRTLQQGVTRFAVAWLEKCAEKHEDDDYDGRNEASCELGKKFVERLDRADRALPNI